MKQTGGSLTAAVGDGITDDKSAIQTIVNQAPPLLVPATHANGKEPPKFMAGAEWEGEGGKGKEEKMDRNNAPFPLIPLICRRACNLLAYT